jgi:hypothetical protein
MLGGFSPDRGKRQTSESVQASKKHEHFAWKSPLMEPGGKDSPRSEIRGLIEHLTEI